MCRSEQRLPVRRQMRNKAAVGIETDFLQRFPASQVRDNEHRDLVDHAVDLKVQHHFRHGSAAAPGLELRNDLQPVRLKPGDEAFREGPDLSFSFIPAVWCIHCRRGIRKLPPVRKQLRRSGRIVLRNAFHQQKLRRILHDPLLRFRIKHIQFCPFPDLHSCFPPLWRSPAAGFIAVLRTT